MIRFGIRVGIGALCLALVLASSRQAVLASTGTVDFEQFSVDGSPHVLGVEDSYHGHDSQPSPADELPEMHPFVCEGVEFYNNYGDYTYQGYSYYGWDGWAVSNMTDTTTPGYLNEFSAITGGGTGGSPNYGVAYLPDNSWFGSDPANEVFRRAPIEAARTGVTGHWGFYLTNTTYSYLAMRDGYNQARAFTADNNDFLCLTISGLDATGTAIAGLDPVEFYLADFRQTREPGAVAGDYIIDQWTWVDVASLVDGGAQQLQFLFNSSDVDETYGINTPLYLAMDNLPSIPGDASLDGNVDEDDAAILAASWGETSGMLWSNGDFNGDGAVNMEDASILAASWGNTVWPPAEAVVPEPGIVTLGLGALIAALCVARRRG